MHVYTKLHLNITILLKITCTSVLIRIKTINVDKALFNIACSKKRIQTIHRNLHVLFFSLPLPLKSKVIFFLTYEPVKSHFLILKQRDCWIGDIKRLAFKISSLDQKAYCVLFRWNNGLRQGCFFNPDYFYEDEVQDKLPVISAQININKTTAIFFLV